MTMCRWARLCCRKITRPVGDYHHGTLIISVGKKCGCRTGSDTDTWKEAFHTGRPLSARRVFVIRAHVWHVNGRIMVSRKLASRIEFWRLVSSVHFACPLNSGSSSFLRAKSLANSDLLLRDYQGCLIR